MGHHLTDGRLTITGKKKEINSNKKPDKACPAVTVGIILIASFFLY